MKYHYIYITVLLRGQLEGHYYIGKHTTEAKPENCGYVGSGRILNNYFKKYGKIKGETYYTEVFEENNSKEENAERENFFVSTLWRDDPLCLNLKAGGDGGGTPGYKWSEESKEKLKKSLKGNPNLSHKGEEHPMYGKHIAVSEETRERLRQINLGRKHSKEFCEKVRQRMKGTTVPQKTREKISESLRGNICWNKMVGAECRYIRQIDKNGHTVKIWDLQKDCFYGFSLSKIKECCKGLRKTHKKCYWEWAPIRIKKIRIAV